MSDREDSDSDAPEEFTAEQVACFQLSIFLFASFQLPLNDSELFCCREYSRMKRLEKFKKKVRPGVYSIRISHYCIVFGVEFPILSLMASTSVCCV